MGHCTDEACLDPELDVSDFHFDEAKEGIKLSEMINLYNTVCRFLGITSDNSAKMVKSAKHCIDKRNLLCNLHNEKVEGSEPAQSIYNDLHIDTIKSTCYNVGLKKKTRPRR